MKNFKGVECAACLTVQDRHPVSWSTFTTGVRRGASEPVQLSLCQDCSRCIESWIKIERADTTVLSTRAMEDA